MSAVFLALLRSRGLPVPQLEFPFARPRRWRFDMCWPSAKLALEIEGGVWTRGRHTRGTGFTRDIEKYNAAGLAGYLVLRCVPDQLATTATLDMVERALLDRARAA